MTSDWKQISQEEHEIEYVLKKFDKRTTRRNIDMLKLLLRKFKEKTSSSDRDEFYKYLKEGSVLDVFD